MNLLKRLNHIFDAAHQTIERDSVPINKDFFLAHLGKLVVFLLVAIWYVDLRYQCESSMFRIASLKAELNDVRYTAIARWGELTEMNKPDVVRRKVERGNVRLSVSDEPPTLVK